MELRLADSGLLLAAPVCPPTSLLSLPALLCALGGWLRGGPFAGWCLTGAGQREASASRGEGRESSLSSLLPPGHGWGSSYVPPRGRPLPTPPSRGSRNPPSPRAAGIPACHFLVPRTPPRPHSSLNRTFANVSSVKTASDRDTQVCREEQG